MSKIPPEIRDVLCCPRCRGPLRDVPEPPALECTHCALRFPVRDGIPVMLLDAASPVGTEGGG